MNKEIILGFFNVTLRQQTKHTFMKDQKTPHHNTISHSDPIPQVVANSHIKSKRMRKYNVCPFLDII